ncbi:MAG: methyl-accepting chemotaxis protein, partial [Rhodospirillales bacterium]|nr:methyl-accepting chemotaxis protein [Rhodospirillales bacterium]
MSQSAKVFSLASRLKVHQKILLGFLVILSLMAFLGLQFVWHIRIIGHEFDHVLDTARDSMDMARLAQSSERLDRVV